MKKCIGMIQRHLFLGIWIIFAMSLSSCSSDTSPSKDTLFERIPSSSSNISFTNELTSTNDFNIYTYANFYSGGGVGLGDFNNDGRLDIYLTANQKKNKLYLNEGNFTFNDITQKAGVGGEKSWSTGVSVADVNGDGWLDIYVCNAGEIRGSDRKNELFINNGDSTFTERAEEYGLADNGLSIHASFFDYDKDGDLDMYLMNYTFRSIGSFDLRHNQRDQTHFMGGDRFYRNELISDSSSSASHDGPTFTDVTEEAGIYSSEIGFGLGVSVADVNRDGWQDMFISNDFFERDYFYLNNRDGTFSEVLEEQMNGISTTSMGGDIADLNHDGRPEIFVTDMLPETQERQKAITSFADWEQYQFEIQHGYYHQFTRNVLQFNNGNGTFSEIGRYAGVEATDWSWGALITDFDMDGERDIFVPNGIYKDITDKDHMRKVSSSEVRKQVFRNNQADYLKLIDMMPSTPVPNYLFKNEGDLQFSNTARAWGLAEDGFSNGAAYGDLDNDGDQDLVVNNVNMESFVYKNRSHEKYPERNWLQLAFDGKAPNTSAVGAQVTVVANGQRWYAEQMPIRGFQSTVDQRLYFGLGSADHIDTLWVRWPNGELSRETNLKPNDLLTLKQPDARADTSWNRQWLQQSLSSSGDISPIMEEITERIGLSWEHTENDYLDFSDQPLLFQARSAEGPPLCTADLNGDGLQDFFVGGAKDQPGVLFMQTTDGRFRSSNKEILNADAKSEDTDCAFFDANGDGATDLYVASGGSAFTTGDTALADRLYLNDGSGQLSKSNTSLPGQHHFNNPTGTVAPGDFDGDGDTDLFIGIRMQPGAYGLPAPSFLLRNDGSGLFTDVTQEKMPNPIGSGLITDAAWGDADNDKDMDLLVAGEWMPVTLLQNDNASFTPVNQEAGLDSTNGWWQSLILTDLDGDGDLDWVAGNHGLNSRFKASPQSPVELWVNDFDENGEVEQIFTSSKGENSYPWPQYHDLVHQLPMLSSRSENYHTYGQQTMQDLFDEQQLSSSTRLQTTMLASSVGWNDGNGRFTVEPLPMQAQWMPTYSLLAQDLNGDKKQDLLLGGNLHEVKPQAGPYDAGYGTVLKQDSTRHFQTLPVQKSGFKADGEIRAIRALKNAADETLIITARNNKKLKVFRITNK
ncbi:VCBS repeat-containing protein [Fodinibius salsisoli]|uniref:VCBS repeat-containing protein n=1 Tax=Fodinibius salsisoli TaxID=2820877 RepID=A0ABT3PPZ6_9BACT|nr:VCBS repeat-containing protein [Fodinibius salsisoli]MCW9707935.1 VCBS repeat-containing protein [Fodinibius salsisoli]